MEGIGAVSADAHSAPSDELVLLNLDSTEKGVSGSAIPIATMAPRLVKTPVELVPLDPLPIADPSDSNGSSNPADSADDSEKALMAGRYRSQISARIERAWIRPRSPVNEIKSVSSREIAETPFVCQVQIRQDTRGNVQEILLLQCNGTEAWRHSLVVAINQASPLPAPPVPSVFAHEIAMTFEALPYEPGAPADQYEREAPAAAIVSNSGSASSALTFDAAGRGIGGSPNDNPRLMNR
jgi:hypothetical protein